MKVILSNSGLAKDIEACSSAVWIIWNRLQASLVDIKKCTRSDNVVSELDTLSDELLTLYRNLLKEGK